MLKILDYQISLWQFLESCSMLVLSTCQNTKRAATSMEKWLLIVGRCSVVGRNIKDLIFPSQDLGIVFLFW